MQERYAVSVRRSCRLALLHPSVWYQKSKARDQSVLHLAHPGDRNGPPTIWLSARAGHALGAEGWAVGKKRVYRLYRLEGLQLRMKVRRRKRIGLQRGRPVLATAPNQHWSMDFVHDQMLDGPAFRVLTVIDQWSRESVSLAANFRLTGRCVGKALDVAARERAWPKAITVDNGTEFTSKVLDESAWRRGVKLDYTRPDKAHGQRADRAVHRALGAGEFLMRQRVHYDAGCAGEVGGLAARLQPLPPAWLTRPPDPERVRQKEVRSTARKLPDYSLKVTEFGGDVSRTRWLLGAL